MDHTGLFCATATQSWNGPKGSTFSPDWKDSLTFLTPDVIKPPLPANQPMMAGLHHPHGVFVSASGPRVGPMDQNQVAAIMIEQSYATVQKDRRGRPLSAIDPHRRSQSLCAAAAAVAAPDTDLVTLRRRCESYAMAYPSSSSDDSGSDSASTRKGELLLPDAVPRPRARSIILRKPKQRPEPPLRTVSLGKTGERRCQSLYIPRDLHSTLLPDLIPIGTKLEDGEQRPLPVDSVAVAKLKTSVSVSASSMHSRPLNELRSSEPCKSQPGSVPPPPPPGVTGSETAKTPSSSDSLTSPTSSSRSSPSQPPATSPSKPTGSTSPSSGYSSQCETPTSSVRTAAIFGPSPMGCRMRPKPAGQKSRASRVRLSLQLPETTAPPAVDESADPVKPSRRYSDSSATVKTKQRCLSMLLPVVTQEDLMNVRLRSVSSSDNEGGRYEGFAEAIAEEAERDTPTPSIESPKNKPPVAPKPAASTWQPVVTAQKDQPETREPQQHNGPERRRAPIPKPKRSSLSLSGSGSVEHHTQPNLGRSLSTSVSETQLPSNTFLRQNTDSYLCDPNDKRRMGPPQVAKKPEVLILPNGHGVCNRDGMTGHIPVHATQDQRLVNGGNIAMQHYMSTGHRHGKYNTMGRNPSSERYQHGVSDPRMMQGFEEGQDEVFASKTTSRTTEDLFTIIHRSKRKLLGRKDSFEGRPSDMGMLTMGGTPRASSQNDSFMALLRRTRSAKAAPGGRISATELLKSSKPTTASGQPYDATRP
ncbi:NHS-like protein 2 [Alosa pseudoharengus]|uniref:NHS-like protein 2 n=1 Tax=Alosa pseudoharengus TaxID=34774 RepID=UPI003F89A5EF